MVWIIICNNGYCTIHLLAIKLGMMSISLLYCMDKILDQLVLYSLMSLILVRNNEYLAPLWPG